MTWAGTNNYGEALGGTPDYIAAFLIANSAGSYLIELVYMFLAAFAFWQVWQMRGQGGRLWLRFVGLLVGLAATILAFEGSLNPFPEYPLNRGVFFALVAIAICALWWLYLRATRPDVVAQAASYATESEPEPAAEPARAGVA